MFKRLLACAALVAFGTVSANAQDQRVIVRKVEVPGVDFAIVFAMTNPETAATIDRRRQTDPLVISSTGDELAHAVEGEVEQMFGHIGLAPFPIHAFRVELKGSASIALNVYVVPKLVPPMQ